MPSVCRLIGVDRKHPADLPNGAYDPSATLGSSQESAQSHLIGGMMAQTPKLPQHVGDELLHVLATVEGDARALSVGQRRGGHDRCSDLSREWPGSSAFSKGARRSSSDQVEVARVLLLGNCDADKRDRISVCIGDNGAAGGIRRVIM